MNINLNCCRGANQFTADSAEIDRRGSLCCHSFLRQKGSKESGATLLSFVIGLGLAGILITLVVLTFQQVFHVQQQIEAQLSVMDALMEAEDFYRKELGRLQFAPYCSSLLPAYQDLFLGQEMDEGYRERLAAGLIISQRVAGADRVVDLLKLKGHGSGTYQPKPPKNISRLLNGADLLYINGLLPSSLRLEGRYILGEYDADLIGLRKGKFYLTDCRNAFLVGAEREGGTFYLNEQDYARVTQLFDNRKLQIYLYKEYLLYLQIRDGVSQFVVDYLDGQAFLRIPHIIDMRLKPKIDGMSVKLIAGIPSYRRKRSVTIEDQSYQRTFLNGEVVRVRDLEVRW